MIRIVRAFDSGSLESEIDQIPVKLRPKNERASRCCVYHDRAILKYRLMALLGISVEDETDETKPLSAYYAEKAWSSPDGGTAKPKTPLSVCGPACSGCPDAQVVSTQNCRGCFARPCVYNCPKKAIEVVDGHSVIDQKLRNQEELLRRRRDRLREVHLLRQMLQRLPVRRRDGAFAAR